MHHGRTHRSARHTSQRAVASLVLGILSLVGSIFTAVPAVIIGLRALDEIRHGHGRIRGRKMALAGMAVSAAIVAVQLIACVAFALSYLMEPEDHRKAARQSMAKLEGIATAMHLYHANYQSFPPPTDTSLSTPISWRVKLLPYLENGRDLYAAYNRRMPWDSPANAPVTDRSVPAYRNPDDPNRASKKTNYLLLVGEDTAFSPQQRYSIESLSNPTQTVLIVEADADRAVHWAEPKDIPFDATDPLAGIGQYRPGGFLVTLADGRVQFVSNSISPNDFRTMVSPTDRDNENLWRYFD